MILSRVNDEQQPINVRIKANRIDVQHFSLSGEHHKYRVNAVQLFAVAQVLLIQDLIQDIH